MNFLELLVAILIAIYAMIGGAFLNAAITAPHNTRKLLIRMWNSIFELMIYGGAIFATAVIGGLLTMGQYSSFFANPFFWGGLAELVFGGMFWVCGVIVRILVDEEQDCLDQTED